jgi:hypothetical protein
VAASRFAIRRRSRVATGAISLFAATAMFGAAPALADPGEPSGNLAPLPQPQIFECAGGPWGRVQWHYIHLEAADWLLDWRGNAPAVTAWYFPQKATASLASFLTASGVPPETVNRWATDPRTIHDATGGVTLYPSPEDIVNLSPPTRAAIYAVLATASENAAHIHPLQILDADVDAWLGRRAVRPAIRELVKKLAYRREGRLCFSDRPVLLHYAISEAEARDLTKLGTRIRCVMAYLQIGPREDTQALDAYWSAGFRRKDALPILDSVSMLPGGGRLGLSHLLPAEARKLLYTYPTPEMVARDNVPDCHWTALNFFTESPQNAFLDPRLARAQVLDGYDAVQPPCRFGDILVFVKAAGGLALHSCVFLCDELVFTKNGESPAAPWIISTLSDVRTQYSQSGSDEIRVYRRRWEKGR